MLKKQLEMMKEALVMNQQTGALLPTHVKHIKIAILRLERELCKQQMEKM